MSNWDLFRDYDVNTTGGSMNPTKFRTPGIDCLHEKYPRNKMLPKPNLNHNPNFYHNLIKLRFTIFLFTY